MFIHKTIAVTIILHLPSRAEFKRLIQAKTRRTKGLVATTRITSHNITLIKKGSFSCYSLGRVMNLRG
ncbi:hypothetical protein TTRE_0000111301 [Trichuris trichiura]|uniref:Uncharacterized protein n=1 Tax=Trichuris trichiura TaxID=36087 RepID=A0A077YYH1_TRITR|nr:hypothetical protein TTRE_0000111301 [Trichuris trichiura]